MNPPNEILAGTLTLAACALIGWGLGQIVNLVAWVSRWYEGGKQHGTTKRSR